MEHHSAWRHRMRRQARPIVCERRLEGGGATSHYLPDRPGRASDSSLHTPSDLGSIDIAGVGAEAARSGVGLCQMPVVKVQTTELRSCCLRRSDDRQRVVLPSPIHACTGEPAARSGQRRHPQRPAQKKAAMLRTNVHVNPDPEVFVHGCSALCVFDEHRQLN